MINNPKLQIYQGIIQYLLDTTGYTLKNIAGLTNASIKTVHSIYNNHEIPAGFSSSEKHLVQLYQMILELNSKQKVNLQLLTKALNRSNS